MLELRKGLMLLSVGAVSLWGCGPEEAVEESPEAAPLAVSEQALNSSGAFDWSQGWVATPMGSSADRVCYLSRMTGNFEGELEYLHAFVSGGSWYLAGSSAQKEVSGSAHCAYTSSGSYSGEYSWSQDQSYPTYLGSATGRVCFLTRVAGKFEGAGEWVHVYTSGGSWYLTGSSEQHGLSASARCVNVSSYSNEYSWYQGQLSTNMGTTSARSCALTFVSGRFQGGGEQISISQSDGYWFLGGRSAQNSVQARSRCF
ncbi:hypothetical protein JQX13_52460 [Archangium violaceum]|uniref:hypothetical protein n=1 Tax=Archangium violaceum TaxID=83451 RepID=UPI00193BE597|nr:hypothetical protein [Archangium violaceum]QRK08436.1 hypothetical protein JQX13_52460 [Archangium violaceum]